MSEIIFDMEWNMGYPKEGEPHFDEIIEIGAVKIADDRIADTYKEYVRPTIHRVIHHHVRKMLPFTQKELQHAKPFTAVIQEFKAWCGPDAQLVSWGNSDIAVLESNLTRYGLAHDWVGPCYDLQAAYAYLLGEYTHQYSLKDAVEKLGIEAPEDFHDAANDAWYTALIEIEIKKQYGALPPAGEIQAKRDELRAIHAEEVRKKSLEMESAALEEAEPLAVSVLPPAASPEAALRTSRCTRWRCPLCGAQVTATGYTLYAERGYITRGQCPEHGWQYPFVSFRQTADGVVGTMSVLPATQRIKNTYFRFGHAGNRKKKKRS